MRAMGMYTLFFVFVLNPMRNVECGYEFIETFGAHHTLPFYTHLPNFLHFFYTIVSEDHFIQKKNFFT